MDPFILRGKNVLIGKPVYQLQDGQITCWAGQNHPGLKEACIFKSLSPQKNITFCSTQIDDKSRSY